MEASAAHATSALALVTTKVGTDLFTVSFSPEMPAALALRTRYIQLYITRLRRNAQSPGGGELAEIATGRLPDDLQGRAFDMMSPGVASMAGPVVRFRIDFAEHST
jgi:hypothetical protein